MSKYNHMTPYECLVQFQTVYNSLYSTVPFLPDEQERKLRETIHAEEFIEFFTAEACDDIIEIADALADILYIAYGTAVGYGLKSISDEMLYNVDSKTPHLPSDDIRERNKSIVMKSLLQYSKAEMVNNHRVMEDALREMIRDCLTVASTYNIPIKDVFYEVHASNMSKLDENGNAILREDGKILKGKNYFPPNIQGVLEDYGHGK